MRLPRLRLRSGERGATVVIVAITATALLGMAAVSVDYASASHKKQEVQAAADAAALEIARDCAESESACQENAHDKAAWYADEIGAQVSSVDISPADNIVRVQLKADTKALFAKAAFGDDASLDGEVTSGASAKAQYQNGTVTSYAPEYPMAFDYCAWKTGGETERWYRIGGIPLPSPTTAPSAACPDPRDGTTVNLDGPHTGRVSIMSKSFFGLGGDCSLPAGRALSVWDHYVDTIFSAVISIDLNCQNRFRKLRGGDVVLVPLYASYKQKALGLWVPQNPSVRIVGFAPFQIADIPKPFKHKLVVGLLQPETNVCELGIQVLDVLDFDFIDLSLGLGCTQIKGKFIETDELFEGAEYGTEAGGVDAPILGAVGAVVNLIQ